MNHKNSLFLLCLAASAATASAATLSNTGVTVGGASLVPADSTANVLDSNFTTNLGTQAYTYDVTPPYVTEVGNGTGRWISTACVQGPVVACNSPSPVFATDAGVYNYTETYNPINPGVTTISGEWASDDCAEIFLNGASTGQTIGGGISHCAAVSGNFTSLHSFSFTADLLSFNTIDFEVYNAELGTALLVTDISAASAPEPSSIGMGVAGLTLVAIGRLRRRRRNEVNRPASR